MIKTQIQMEEWQYARLKRLSASQASSMSEVVRQAVAQLLDRSVNQTTCSLEEIAGKYAGESLEDIKAHDRAWVEAIR